MAHLTGEIIHQRYCVVDILGEGGTGITYRALDQHTDQQVAIKTLALRQVKDWKVVELFEREAKVLQQLQHPHIPKYLDYFVSANDRPDSASPQAEQNFYIVQELAEGKSLFRWLQEDGRCTEAEVKAIAVQVLKILGYLHGLNPPVIHRDIKPHNLIRREDGHIFLVDFGAVQNTYHSTFMRGSTVVGTFGYMAPEQFRGQAAPATDFYGLGATLLFLLTQRSPAELPTQKLKVEFRSRIKLSDSFADWLEKMLEPAAKDRFESAQEALINVNKKLLTGIKGFDLYIPIGGGLAVIALMILVYSSIDKNKYYLFDQLGWTSSSYSQIQKNKISIDKYSLQGGDINAKDQYGQTLIFHAVHGNDIEKVKFLVSKGANLKLTDQTGRTLLHIAASKVVAYPDSTAPEDVKLRKKIQGMLSYLLSLNQIDIDANDNNNKTSIESISLEISAQVFADYIKGNKLTPSQKQNLFAQLLDHALKNRWFKFALELENTFPRFNSKSLDIIALKAIVAEDKSTLQTFIRRKQKINASVFKQINFHNLNRFMENDKILKLLPNINTIDSSGLTLLNRLSGDIKSDEIAKLIRHLIQMGGDVNKIDNKGASPLLNCLMLGGYSGMEKQREEVATALIKAGADVNHRAPLGGGYISQQTDGGTALHLAAQQYSHELVALILRSGANPNAIDDDGATPLHQSVFNSDLRVVEILISAGSNVNARDRNGRTPLDYIHIYSNYHHKDVGNLLKQFGARRSSP